jgi:hypothetical protein
MEPKMIIENLRKVRTSENNAKLRRKAMNNEIASINKDIDEKIDSDTDVLEIRKLKNKRTHSESLRKELNSEIHKLTAAFDDLLFERGDYDADQLTMFDKPEGVDPDEESEDDEESEEDFFGEDDETEGDFVEESEEAEEPVPES